MSKRIGDWESRQWVPAVGMRIRYRSDKKLPHNATPGQYATIVHIDGTILRIQRAHNSRITHLSEDTWKGDWEPYPAEVKPSSVQLQLPTVLSEDDVRRIVREELRAMLAP